MTIANSNRDVSGKNLVVLLGASWMENQKTPIMDVRILIETEIENGDVRRHELGRLSYPKRAICGEGVGLMFEDARETMKGLQAAIVVDQIEEFALASRTCPACQTRRRLHDCRARKHDTLGSVESTT